MVWPGVVGVGWPALLGDARAPAQEADGRALRRAGEEFEALFLGLLFRQMRASVPRGGLLPTGTTGELFEELWGQEVARAAARRGPLGLAEALREAAGRSSRGGVPPNAHVGGASAGQDAAGAGPDIGRR